MSWKNRLDPYLKLTSPSGIEFFAKWKGNQRSMEKAIGVHKFPKIAGAVLQDMDVNAVKYPLTFWFDGPDHDIEAEQFFNACAENGNWSVYHPVRGALVLQLVSVSEDIEPVDNANVTMITTDWLEPMEFRFTKSTPQVSADVEEQISKVQYTGAKQFVDCVIADEAGPLESLVNSIDDALKVFHETLDPLSQQLSDIYAQCSLVYTSINSAIRSVTMEFMTIGTLAQMLVTLPVMASKSTFRTLEYCNNMMVKMLSFTPPALPMFGSTKKQAAKGVNRLVVQELILTSYVAAVSRVIVDATDITSREEALYYIDMISDQFNTIVETLDNGQNLYADMPIGNQYFSMSQNFDNVLQLVTMVQRLLLQRAFDLSIAKKITLQTPRSPVEIAITEGVDLDVFIATNHLKSSEILLLPAGREVVVYL